MATPVITLNEIEKVKRVMEVLNTTNHNGFPVISKDGNSKNNKKSSFSLDKTGRLRGLILRKTLCGLLKLKAYSTPTAAPKNPDGGINLVQAATVFYDTLEKHYPNYPDVRSVKLLDKEMVTLQY
jgi:hypothetical protein